MRINGNCRSLGQWNIGKPQKMSLRPSGGRPGLLDEIWSYDALIPSHHRYIEYKYSIYNPLNDSAVWER